MTGPEAQESDPNQNGHDGIEQMKDSESDTTDITIEARGAKQVQPKMTPRSTTIPTSPMPLLNNL